LYPYFRVPLDQLEHLVLEERMETLVQG